MAKILCIDDYPMYAQMVASLLEQRGGYEVLCAVVPLDVTAILAFGPELVIVNLVRRLDSISAGGMRDFYHEVEGARAFRALAAQHLQGYPVIVTGLAVSERDVPRDLHYDAFIEIPQKLENLLPTVERVLAARRQAHGVRPE